MSSSDADAVIFSIMSMSTRHDICRSVLLRYNTDTAFCAVYQASQSLIIAPGSDLIILDDWPSEDKADRVITADASNRPLLPPPKLMQANRKQKLIHLLNFPVSVRLDIEQLRSILKQ